MFIINLQEKVSINIAYLITVLTVKLSLGQFIIKNCFHKKKFPHLVFVGYPTQNATHLCCVQEIRVFIVLLRITLSYNFIQDLRVPCL